MTNVEAFKFVCQKVLPLVYDDSLSYYEVLCKVSTKLNETIDAINGNNDKVAELEQYVLTVKELIEEIGLSGVATYDKLGMVKVDIDTLEIDEDGLLVVRTATGETKGIVGVDGETISIEDGIISAIAGGVDKKGILQIDGVTIVETDGKINVPDGSASAKGIFKIDGETLVVEDGVLKVVREGVPIATTENTGVVKVDGTTIVVSADGTIKATGVGTAEHYLLEMSDGKVFELTVGEYEEFENGYTVTVNDIGGTPHNIIRVDETNCTVDGASVTYTATHVEASGYTLPVATSGILGGVKVGNGVKVDGAGVLSVDSDVVYGKFLSHTMSGGEVEFTFVDDVIGDDSWVRVGTSEFGVVPSGMAQEGNVLTVTFDEAHDGMVVKVVVRNGNI